LRNAIIAGTKTAPHWVSKLDFANDMHLPPWEIFGGEKVLWFYRWKTRREFMILKAQADQRQG